VTSVTVELSGPFFQHDPGETLRENITRMMEALAQEGERAARDAFRATQADRQPISLLGDRISDHVEGRVVSVRGKRWRASAVVSVHNDGFSALLGKSLMAAASEAERETHIFRSLARNIRNARATYADLAKGIE
jgi:hypothetical protein